MEASIRPGTWFLGEDFTPNYTNYTIPSNYHTWQMPFSFHTNLTNLAHNIDYIMLANELAMQTTIQQYDGAIGYYMATQDGFDPTTQMITGMFLKCTCEHYTFNTYVPPIMLTGYYVIILYDSISPTTWVTTSCI